MVQTAADYLKRRDAWMREVLMNSVLTRNAKLTGVHVALRLSHKKPSCYPAMQTMAKDLGISTRQIARGLRELEDEGFVNVRRRAGTSSLYSLNL